MCCLSMPVKVIWDSRHTDYPAGWRSCTPITITGLGSKHTALLDDEVHHGRASPQFWGAAGTLLGDKCQGVLGSFVLAGPHRVSGMHTSVTFQPRTTVRVQPLANL